MLGWFLLPQMDTDERRWLVPESGVTHSALRHVARAGRLWRPSSRRGKRLFKQA